VGKMGISLLGAQKRSGVCRFCGCTAARPCVFFWRSVVVDEGRRLPAGWLPGPGAAPGICAWADAESTVCSAPSCILALYREAVARVEGGA
jgi:hypothetical protein